MSDKIKAKTQKLDQDPMVHLYELDLTPLGDDILRFCSSIKDDGTPLETDVVKFGGFDYEPRAVIVTGFKVTGEGPVPQPVLRISNLDNQVGQAIAAHGDLVGIPFKRMRTYREHLDGEADPDATATFPADYYLIEQKSVQNSMFVEWVLTSVIDQEGKMLPGRQVLRDVCTWRYRRWDADLADFDYSKAKCPYAGAGYFDKTGAPTTADKDHCNKQLSACQARFGNAPLPFSGFPAVAKVR